MTSPQPERSGLLHGLLESRDFHELLVFVDGAAASRGMLAGLAHEFANIHQAMQLTTAGGGSSSAQRWVDDAMNRAVAVLRAITTSSEGEVGPVVMADVVAEALEWQRFQKRLPEAHAEATLADNLPAVRGHHARFRQALLALLTNAKEAVRDGSPAEIRVSARAMSDGVQVSVEDNGHGVPDHERERVFEPFFTTRSRATHAGVGLTVCRYLVGRVGGTVVIEGRSDGPGTRAVMQLPAWAPRRNAA